MILLAHELLTLKALEKLFEKIDKIEFTVVKGFLMVAFWLLSAWFLLYFLGWQAFFGHWQRTLWVLGVWLAIEFFHWVGKSKWI